MLNDTKARNPRSLSGVAVRGAFTIVAVLLSTAGCSEPANSGPQNSLTALPGEGSGLMTGDVQDAFLQWPLPPGAEAYGDIDGRHLLEYVVEQVEISRRYRDQGHPKYWGRIIGTSADAESADWVAAKFDEIGLSDVHIQSFDLQPQWMPQSWEVSVTSSETTLKVETAQPVYRATGTPPGGLDLEAVYVGLGSEADFIGRDVEGKAVFAHSMFGVMDDGALPRADARGAAAVFDVHMLPGNCATRRTRRTQPSRPLPWVGRTGPPCGISSRPRRQVSRYVCMCEWTSRWSLTYRPRSSGARCRARQMRRSTSWPIGTGGSMPPATTRRA